mgnify:CR=1 FL=1
MSSQLRRKDLKRPDEFVSYGQAAIRWLQANQRQVLLYSGAALVLLAFLGAATAYRRTAARRASEELGAALAVYRAGRFEEAATRLSEVAARWGSSRAGQLALATAAQAKLHAAQPKDATESLQSIASGRDLPEVVRQHAALGLGYAQEALGDLAAAQRAFSMADQLSGPYRAVARYEQLRLAQRSQDSSKVASLLESLERDFAQSEETRRAKALLRKE